MTDYYKELFLRNEGYVSPELQEKIRNTRLLIAGCGIGSTIAEAAVRLGFEHFILADGDTVAVHNLNRQAYDFDDVGKKKVEALAARLKRINPHLEIELHSDWITPENAAALVAKCDFILDTIDFLDIAAITAVHDAARVQKRSIISGVSAGWGAVAVYVPPTGEAVTPFRRIFKLPDTGPVQNESYVGHFAHLIDGLKDQLDPKVVEAMAKALTVMEDGTPCPAPHVSAGSTAVASLATTMIARILNGEPVAAAPRLIAVTMDMYAKEGSLDM